MKYDTIEQAAQAWVSEMYHIPRSVVEKLEQYSNYTDIQPVFEENGLPMWGMMWAMMDPCDIDWAESEVGLASLDQSGFSVYRFEDYGIIFGIDGAGYSFYEEHWIPLYKLRGLHWHKEEAL